MSTDIHLHFERKLDEKWQEIEIDDVLIPNDRHYELFGFLGSVRGSIDGVFSHRGVPDDSTANTLRDHPDFYSHSFAYLDEILNAPWQRYHLQDTYFYAFCRHVLPRLCAGDYTGLTDLECRDIRIIFAFSN